MAAPCLLLLWRLRPSHYCVLHNFALVCRFAVLVARVSLARKRRHCRCPSLPDTSQLPSSSDETVRLTLRFSPSPPNQRFLFCLHLWQSHLGTLSASHSSSTPGLFEAPLHLSVVRTFSYNPPPHLLCFSPSVHTPLNSSRWAVTGPLT